MRAHNSENETRSRVCSFTKLIGFVLLSLVTSVNAQSVDRLFSTQQQRDILDQLRARGGEPEPEVVQPLISIADLEELFEEETPEEDVVYALGGIMKQRDGRYTVWVNGQAIEQQNLPENMELLVPFERGQLRISHPISGASFDVKPGQVLNLSQGELLESYQVMPEPLDEAVAADIVQDAESAILAGSAGDLVDQAKAIQGVE